MSEPGALICGFWDEPAKLAGIAWRLGGSGGVLWRDGEVAAASAQLDDEGERVRVRLEAGGDACVAEFAASEEAPLEAGAGEPAAAAGTAKVSAGAGNGRALSAPGLLTRFGRDPTEGAALLRHLAIPARDGATLVVLATGAEGASYDEERTSAWLLGAGGAPAAFGEALLSTQYDAEGKQSRAGLELWSEDEEEPPVRAAGTLLGAVPAAEHGVSAALMRTSADGAEGLGSYLIWRG